MGLKTLQRVESSAANDRRGAPTTEQANRSHTHTHPFKYTKKTEETEIAAKKNKERRGIKR